MTDVNTEDASTSSQNDEPRNLAFDLAMNQEGTERTILVLGSQLQTYACTLRAGCYGDAKAFLDPAKRRFSQLLHDNGTTLSFEWFPPYQLEDVEDAPEALRMAIGLVTQLTQALEYTPPVRDEEPVPADI